MEENCQKKDGGPRIDSLKNCETKQEKRKTLLGVVLKTLEIAFVCIVYLLVSYFIAVAESAFYWDTIVDSVCNLILLLLFFIILPAMLIKYLYSKIRTRWIAWIILLACYIALKFFFTCVGSHSATAIFEPGLFFK